MKSILALFHVPFACCASNESNAETLEHWCKVMNQSLVQRTKDLGMTESLRQALLFQDESDDLLPVIEMEAPRLDEEGHLVGLPSRPFHRDLAQRLYLLSSNIKSARKANTLEEGSASDDNDVLVPSVHLCMTELQCAFVLPVPSKASVSEFSRWLKRVGDDGVLRVLGMRNTVGTAKGLLPPSWSQLLEASAVPNSPKALLSVAARARAKHAHRGAEQFFGVPKGNQASQNEQSKEILLELMKNTVWINIHMFSGMEQPVLEIRNSAGYGARWKAEWRTNEGDIPTTVTFRGFLEPHMPGGHEIGWKH